ASFYMENQLMKIALNLLEKNLKLRPCSESYQALAQVQANLKLKILAQKNIKIALFMPLISSKLCQLASELLSTHSKEMKRCQKLYQ
ncbi:hypothetical protein MJH12_06960, partial [bacterium]|nr:hypothetical protein [bacterium]